MSNNVEFYIVENPSVKRVVSIAAANLMPKKMDMKWRRLNYKQAAEMIEDYDNRTGFYVDEETGEVLSLNQASSKVIEMRDTDGGSVPVPVLYDNVLERKTADRLEAQRAFLKEIIAGIQIDENGNEKRVQPLLLSWGLTMNGVMMDFQDPAIFDMVFDENEYFFPVLNDVKKMLNDLTGSGDQEKNLKTSANSGQNRR